MDIMKQKGSIALVSMILFILLCSGIFAEDDSPISEDELMVWRVSYEGGEYYSWRIFTYIVFDSEHQFKILSIPESFIDISIYERKNNKELSKEYYEIIENELKLEEVCRKRNILIETKNKLKNELLEAKEVGWNLLLIFYPSYLEQEKFLFDIHFKDALGKY